MVSRCCRNTVIHAALPSLPPFRVISWLRRLRPVLPRMDLPRTGSLGDPGPESNGTSWNIVWVSPVVWTAVEKFCPELFPVYLGASHYNLLYLTQIADVTGILGVTFLTVYLHGNDSPVLEAVSDDDV
jgi:hypothetical protein